MKKKTRDAIAMLRIRPARTLDINDESCACFTDWQKAFDSVNWTKLLKIVKGTDIEWRERRLISNLCIRVDQIVKLRVDQRETRSVKKEDELDQDAVCHRFCSTRTTNTLPRKFSKDMETSG